MAMHSGAHLPNPIDCHLPSLNDGASNARSSPTSTGYEGDVLACGFASREDSGGQLADRGRLSVVQVGRRLGRLSYRLEGETS
jgi:hypothetical protein